MDSLASLRRDPLRTALIALALVYALLAGLKTVADPDLGWQLATGRYIVQHHTIPSTDLLSSTARGKEWIYPPASGVLLYGVWRMGGWAALSWLNALACVAAAALLLAGGGRRLAALLTLLAVPAMSFGTEPRSELFTTLIFAASFGILWRHYRGERARLWLLPVLMALWVNLHTGFAAGFALLAGYVVLEAFELPFAARRAPAIARLRRAAPWCLLTALATLANPWGPYLYGSMQRQNQAIAVYGTYISWWSPVKLSSAALGQLVNLRDSASGDWWLLLIAACAAIVYLARGRPGPAALLAGGAYISLLHIRLQVLFAVLVVMMVGAWAGSENGKAAAGKGLDVIFERWTHSLRERFGRRNAQLAILAVAALLVGLRCYDLVTDRQYLAKGQVSLFGTGPSWWFPERAAQFLLRERIPGEIFNGYDIGGYLAFRTGPEYLVYADGRYIPFGIDVLLHTLRLTASPPDSAEWDQEVAQHNINLVFFSLSRYGQLEAAPLAAFCASRKWKAVHLDEVSAIFLRVRPENQPWLDRLGLDCRTAPIPAPAMAADSRRHRAQLYEYYANAGSVFFVLSRDAEAAAALDRAESLFSDDPNLHLIRGEFLAATNHAADAEREIRASLDLQPTDAAWYALGRIYGEQHRYAEAAECLERSAELSVRDYERYRVLGQIYLLLKSPRQALEAFDRAQRRSPFEGAAAVLGVEFHARLAEDRAHAWRMLGDLARATQYTEQSVQFTPDSVPRWLLLADLYAAQGKTAEAAEARSHAAALTAPR